MKTNNKIPDGYLCPITQEIMTDPVVAADGHTYERLAIQQWFTHRATSPNTGLTLPNRNLLPNIALKKAIREYVETFEISTSSEQRLFSPRQQMEATHRGDNDSHREKPGSCAIL